MKGIQSIGILLISLFMMTNFVHADVVDSPFTVEVHTLTVINPKTTDEIVVSLVVKNTGATPIDITKYEGQINYDSCEAPCVEVNFAECTEDCFILGVGEEKWFSYSFIPSIDYGAEAGGYYGISGSATGTSPDGNTYEFWDATSIYVLPGESFASEGDDPYLGPSDANIRIIEFGNFSGPYSKNFHDETLPTILQNFVSKGKVKYVFRDFPFDFFPNDFAAAYASECADMQVKYWEYHDLLFDNVSSFGDENFIHWAGELGMNPLVFQDCLNSAEIKNEVNHDFNEGVAAGVSGVPTFFVQNVECNTQQLLVGSHSFSTFESAILNQMNEDCSSAGGDVVPSLVVVGQQFNKVELGFQVENIGNEKSTYSYLVNVSKEVCEDGSVCDYTFYSCDSNSECFSLEPSKSFSHNLSFPPSLIFPGFNKGSLIVTVVLLSNDDVDLENNSQTIQINFVGTEICDDGLDNDDNGKTDCSDTSVCMDFCFSKLSEKVRIQQDQLDDLAIENERLISRVSKLDDLLSRFIESVSTVFCSKLNVCLSTR